MFFISTLLIVGGFLIIRAFRTKLKNLLWLGLGFIFVSFGFICNFIFNLGLLVEEFFVSTGFILAVIYTNLTFHKERGNKANIMLLIIIIIASIHFYLKIRLNAEPTLFNHYLQKSFDIALTLLVFNWMGWSSYSSYKRIRDQNIYPWIKVRYKILSLFSIILSIQAIPEIFFPMGLEYGEPNNFLNIIAFGITSILVFSFSVAYLLAWIMPKRFKKYLNRNYQPIEDKNYSEQELMVLIKNQLFEKKL
jgi:hypothetical protein